MPVDLSVVQGDYFRDLLRQPDALRDTLEQLTDSKELRALASRLRNRKFKSVVLTGMGSSFHGLNPLLLQLTNTGHSAILTETSELVYYRRHLLNPDTLLIAVSQSGRSAELIRLLHDNRGRAPIITITNTPDSPLARRSSAVIFTHAGEEFSVSCKTYVCALLAIKFLGDYLCGVPAQRTRKELATVVRPVAHYLARWKEHVSGIVPQLQGIRQMFLVGRGPSLAAVGTGALILKESTQFPAEGLSSAGFRHGPFEMVGPETFVLIFGGEAKTRDLNKRLLNDIRANSGCAELVSQEPGDCAYCLPRIPSSLLPVLEILPVQMLTLALAARDGRQPGTFRLASKVTTTE
ncbi:MAG TPA: SIS domain-containing protein [Verrucomicrobiae bacterium]|nr:SIS domain-containing protein [Verrucomicrobiae bacterium]